MPVVAPSSTVDAAAFEVVPFGCTRFIPWTGDDAVDGDGDDDGMEIVNVFFVVVTPPWTRRLCLKFRSPQ